MDSSTLDASSACFARDEAANVALREFFESIERELPTIIETCVQPLLDSGTVTTVVAVAVKSAVAECAGSFGIARHRDNFERGRAASSHFALGLQPDLLISTFGRLREQLVARAASWAQPLDRRLEVLAAMNRELDSELTLVLGAYAEFERRKITTDAHSAAIARLSVSLGHQLRNPLATIETSAYLIAQRLGKLGIADDGIDRHLEKVRKHVQLCSRIIGSLQELARCGNPARRLVKLEPVLDEALDAITWPGSIRRVKAVALGLEVFADREQLCRLLVSMFENARDAMQESGKLEVTAVDCDDGVLLRICNDGPSIPLEHQKRIFEPFYTTKAGRNGLGLSLCHRIVVAHGGTLELEPNRAAVVFRVWFPAESAESRSYESNQEGGVNQ